MWPAKPFIMSGESTKSQEGVWGSSSLMTFTAILDVSREIIKTDEIKKKIRDAYHGVKEGSHGNEWYLIEIVGYDFYT